MISAFVPKSVQGKFSREDSIMLSATRFHGNRLPTTVRRGLFRGGFEGLLQFDGPPAWSLIHEEDKSMWRVYDCGDSWRIDWRGALSAPWGPAPAGGTLVCRMIERE